MFSSTYEKMLNHPSLENLPDKVVLAMSQFAMVTQFQAKQLIFKREDVANRFYLIESGQVEVGSFNSDTEDLVETIGPGDVLGWSWMFEPHRWQFDARALGTVEAIFFYATPLLALCEEDAGLNHELMKWSAGVMLRRLKALRKNNHYSGRGASQPDPEHAVLSNDPWPWAENAGGFLHTPKYHLAAAVV